MIKAKDVVKTYRIPHERRDTVFENVRGVFNPLSYEDFKALDEVSIDVSDGEFVGLIGLNGSGKSTLLKVLAGIIQADSGSVEVKGSVVPFLELGLGFSGELTAKENVILNGMLLGLSKRQVRGRFQEIIRFAGLERFVDTKIKNYSAGMHARLAFSVAKEAMGDVFLVDEVLSVGDIEFQKKCFDVIRDFKRGGKTVVLVTHNMQQVTDFCDRTYWLSEGKVEMSGKPKDVVSAYVGSLKHDGS